MVVAVIEANGIEHKQTYAKKGQSLDYTARHHAHAHKFQRVR